MMNQVRNVTANFAAPSHTLDVTASGSGSGTISSNPAGISCQSTAGQESGTCTASFLQNTAVSLTASPSSGHTFVGWTGACAGSATICNVTMSQARSVSANFSAPNFTLSLTAGGTGNGSVVSTPSGISCQMNAGATSGTCISSYAQNAPVTLTANASSGHSFTNWGGACSGSLPTCQVTMSQSRSVTATFTSPAFALAVNLSGTGSGTVSSTPSGINCQSNGGSPSGTCSSQYAQNTMVNLSASPFSGHTFVGWTGPCSGTGICQVTISQARTVGASFSAPVGNFTLTILGGGNGDGVVPGPNGSSCVITGGVASGTCVFSTVANAQLQLGALPASGHTFTGWSGACGGTGSCNLTMSQDRTITASFAAPIATYTLSVSAAGAGNGTVSSNVGGINCNAVAGTTSGTCAANFTSNALVTLSYNPSPGHVFSGWSGACGGNGSCQVSMTQAKSVTATFAPQVASHLLSVTSAGSGNGTVVATLGGVNCVATAGSISGTCIVSYQNNSAVTLNATASSGHTFAGWSGACSGTSTCQLTMTQAQNVTANFTAPTAASAIPNGVTVSIPSGAQGSWQYYYLDIPAGQSSLSVSTSGGSGDMDLYVSTQLPIDPSTATCISAGGSNNESCAIPSPAPGRWYFGLYGYTSFVGANIVATYSAPVAAFVLTVGVAGTGDGIITSTPAGINCVSSAGSGSGACSQSYQSGSLVSLSAISQSGHNFSGWSGACSGTGQCQVSMSAARSVTATFTATTPQCDITSVVSPAIVGGAISVTGSLTGPCGRAVQLTAIPNGGYRFKQWADGIQTPIRNVVVAQPFPNILPPEFVLQCNLDVRWTPPNGGTVTATAGNINGDCGRAVTLTATPAQGFYFATWHDDDPAPVKTFNAGSPGQQFTANFTQVPAPCTLVLTQASGGIVAVTDGALTGACPRPVTIEAFPNAGYRFGGWSDGTTTNPYVVSMTLPTITLAPTFIQQCVLTLSASPVNGGSVAGGGSGDCNRTVTIQAVPASGFTFNAWSDGITNPSRSLIVTQTNQSITANFTTQCTLTLNQTTGGTIAVASGTATGACGRSLTLQATPSAGYRFDKWSDNTSASPYTLTITQSLTISANWIQQCVLTLSSSPAAGGSVSGGGSGDCGRTATVSATPASGFMFSTWSDGNTTPSRTIAVNNVAQSLVASFIAVPPPCTLTLANVSGGTIVLVAGTLTGTCGRSVSVQATAASGYRFDKWSDNTPSATYTFPLTQSITLAATFIQQCSLSLVASPANGGTVTGGGNGDCGRNANVTATPASGFNFVGWSDGNTSATRALTVTSVAQVLTANFTQIAPCDLTLTNSLGGTIALTSGTLTGVCGRSVTVQATATSGYRFDKWSDNATTPSYTLTLSQPKTLGASFIQQCVLTLTANPAVGGTVSGSGTGDCGRVASVQATPSSGYAFTGWSDGNQAVARSVTVSAVAQTLTANFAATPPCTVTLNQTVGGTIGISNGTASGTCGRTVTLSATAGTGYRFDRWSDNFASAQYTLTVTQAISMSATFVPQCVLTLIAVPAIGGTVQGNANVDCGRSEFIQAIPAAGYTFSSWSDGNTASSRVVVVNSATLSLQAAFIVLPPPCTLTIGAVSGGALSITGGTLTGPCGRSVTTQAIPNAGYRFEKWSDNTTTSTYTFVLSQSMTISASFIQQCTLTLSANPTNGGTLTGGSTDDCGRIATVQAIPSSQYTFSNWSDGNASPLRGVLVTQVIQSLVANFTAITNCLLTIGPGLGGSVTIVAGSAAGSCGRTVSLQATAASGYRFDKWSDNSTNPNYSVVVSQPLTLSASFIQQCALTLSASPAAGGTATGSGTGDCGRVATIQASPTNGYTFKSWSDGNTQTPRTIQVTQVNQSLTANFEVVDCSLTVAQQVGGIASVASGFLSGNCGRTVSLVAEPTPGYVFLGWRINGVIASVQRSYLITVTQAQQVAPVFESVVTVAPRAANGLLGLNQLASTDVAAFDETGNRNGRFDVGDLLAMLDGSTNIALSKSVLERLGSSTSPLKTIPVQRNER